MATREITLGNLAETIENNEIVLLDFWAAWCRPCRMFGPIFEEASQRHPDVVFGKVDTEAEQELAISFGVSSIPTVAAFRDGVLIFAQPGMLSGSQLDTLVAAIRDLDMDQVRAQLAGRPAA